MLALLNEPIGRMRARFRRAAMLLVLGTSPLQAQSLPVAAPRSVLLGTCRLSTGATIQPCRVAYRTFGTLSAARDNVVLIPSFFAGRSEDHLFMLGSYVDTTRYHVVIVDALADGHSASPSNTPMGRSAFDRVTIGDMVDVQYRFLTEHLRLRSIHAVVGISMGGFQALEWAVRYPTFMDAAVPIVATPRLTTYDKLIFDMWRRSAEALDIPSVNIDSAWVQASRLEALFMKTTRALNDSGDIALARSVRETASAYRAASWSLADYAAQLRAIVSHDISARFDGDMTRAAAAVKARLLFVVSPDDMLVDPRPAESFARLVHAEIFMVPSPCGHAVFWCEPDRIGQAVQAFIARNRSGALPSSSSRQSRNQSP